MADTTLDAERMEELREKVEAGEIDAGYVLQELGGSLEDVANVIDGELEPEEPAAIAADVLRKISSMVRVEALQVRARAEDDGDGSGTDLTPLHDGFEPVGADAKRARPLRDEPTRTGEAGARGGPGGRRSLRRETDHG